MPVQRNIPFDYGVFSITITCSKWLPLIQIADGYEMVYDWFKWLEKNGHKIIGYVIMPNHLHVMIAFHQTNQKINTIIGNGKRFMAYALIKKLKEASRQDVLDELAKDVSPVRRMNKKLHNVWEQSFDWKYCTTHKFIWQKLQYYHENPCRGKWNLVPLPIAYVHSSANFYATGRHSAYPVFSFKELDDVDFAK